MTTATEGTPDVPLGGLAPASWVLLRNSPLQVVVSEVKWARTEIELDGERGLELRDAAGRHGLELTRIEPVQQQSVRVDVAPEGPTAVVDTGAQGLRLSASNGAIVLTVFPDSLVVQCNAYRRWGESLAPQLTASVAAVLEVIGPRLLQRVGLRYVNRLLAADATSPQVWSARIAPSFLGPLLDAGLGTLVVSAQQQVELKLTDTAGAIIRHGPYRDGSVDDTFAYLLDIDVFVERSERFDAEAISTVTRHLNRTAASLFQQIVDERWRDTMGPYRDTTPDETGLGTLGDGRESK